MTKTVHVVECRSGEIHEAAKAAFEAIAQRIDGGIPAPEVFKQVTLSAMGCLIGTALHGNVDTIRQITDQIDKEVDVVEKFLEFLESKEAAKKAELAGDDLAGQMAALLGIPREQVIVHDLSNESFHGFSPSTPGPEGAR